MVEKKKSLERFALLLLASMVVLSGCVQNIPLSEDTLRDTRNLFPVTEKIHAKVGVYISDDLRSYIIRQEKMGVTFQMDVGRYLVPICMQMASAMFDEAVEVNSVPPYLEAYRPDVEAVVEPEVLYAYGNAVGFLSGQIEAKVKFRIKAYDLSGKTIWQGEAMGEARNDNVDFVATLLSNLDRVGKVGYQAAFLAAQKIVRDFNASKPPELYALLEVKALAEPKSQKKSAVLEQADKLYQKGLYHFDKKNFQQALYGFQQAEKLNPDDPVFRFYVGISRMYTGQRARAIEDLKYVLAKCPKGGKLAGDCKSWIERLNDPLKISVVFVGSKESFPEDLRRGYLQALNNCGMYNILGTGEALVSGPQMDSAGLNRLLEDCLNKKGRIVLFVQGVKNTRELADPGMKNGDSATECTMDTNMIAYGTKKKKVACEVVLTESAARLPKQTEQSRASLYLILTQKSAERAVLSLLGNEVF